MACSCISLIFQIPPEVRCFKYVLGGPNTSQGVWKPRVSKKICGLALARPGTHKMLLKREKHRKSYDFRAWRIDFTAVQSTSEHGEKHLSYEVGVDKKKRLKPGDLPSPETNISRKFDKFDGWKVKFNFQMANFQGRTVSF